MTTTAATRTAVFLDRDGTLIESVHYLSDPGQVRVLPGVNGALRRLRAAGFVRVIATNQAAIGKGLLTTARLEEIHAELARQLALGDATVDAIYHCPTAGVSEDRTVVEFPDRKPGPGMLLRAAREMRLDLSRSWMIGDQVSDALAGHHAGCRSILVGRDAPAQMRLLDPAVNCLVARDVAEAVEMILSEQPCR
jgi:D-glycero-D-manno-heptose 1,7-bisphosphate phosphatase